MPALLKRTSSRPNAFSASATIRSASSARETSATTTSASPPAARISPTVACAALAFRSTATTRAPSFAKRIALSRPIPLAAPVMRATFPFSLMSCPFEEARPLPGRDDLVELPLLGPQEMEVVLEHGVAERLARKGALLEERGRVAQV